MAGLRVEEGSARYLSQIEPTHTRGFELLATAQEGVAKLRELVLAMALQGKLTKPEAGDGSVDSLLDEIKGRREHRVASGELRVDKPSLRFADDQIPFAVPKHWHWVRLGQLGQIVGGGTPKSDDTSMWSPAGIPWLTPADLYRLREKTIGRGRRDISDKGLAKSSARVLPAGTVLFSSRAPIGYVAIARNALATNQGFKSCVPHVPGLADYLYWYLKHAARGIDAAASGTTFKEVSGTEFACVLVPLPPLAEQHRIVARVEELMKRCDALEQNGRLADEQHARLTSTLFDALAASESAHALAENWQRVAEHFDLLLDRAEAIDAFEQATQQIAVRGGLVPQIDSEEHAELSLERASKEIAAYRKQHVIQPLNSEPIPPAQRPFSVPRGWAWARLESVFKVITDGDHQAPPKSESGVAFLTIGNITTGTLDFNHCRYVPQDYWDRIGEYRRPERGDLLYTVVGATYGRPALVDTDRRFCVQRHIAILKPAGEINRAYLHTLMRTPFVFAQAASSVTGTAQPTIPLRPLRNFVVPIPPLGEQRRIVARVEELRRLCANLRRRLTEARETQSRLADALVAELA